MSVHPGPTSTPKAIDPSNRSTATLPVTLVYPIARSILADAPAGPSAIIELCVQINEHGITLSLVDPKGSTLELDPPNAEVTAVRSAGGWMHIDAQGIISCSISGIDTDSPTLVYAKTTLLGQLGLRGGRFDPPTLRSGG